MPVVLSDGQLIGTCSLRVIQGLVTGIFCLDENIMQSNDFYYRFLPASAHNSSLLKKIVVEKINQDIISSWCAN